MAGPSSRTLLRDYCLRRLGSPINEINITPTQMEDRIDDTVQLFQRHGYDGSVRTYLKHEVTSDDVTNKYIPVPDSVTFIRGVLPVRSRRSSSASMFDIRYQLHLNDIFDLSYAGALSHYVQTKQYIDLIQLVINGYDEIEFSRLEGRIYFPSLKWNQTESANTLPEIVPGDFIVIDAYRMIEPTDSTKFYNDPWVKKYTTALFKKQWGENLKKFTNVQLPGGIGINAEQIYTEAVEEVKLLEEELIQAYQLPTDFFIG